MEKRILLIGNSNGLPGVKVDIENYQRFFKSPFGGEWQESEIIQKLNVTKSDLTAEISRLKTIQYNYLIVIFSGHGGQERETMLELNAAGECISENDLKNLAYRQLNIYDCCRAYPEAITKSVVNEMRTKLFSVRSTREKYEKRIMEAGHQQVYLYACAVGECANDTSKGGAYSKNFINCASAINGEYKLIGSTHEEAAVLTTREFSSQHPEAILPRLISTQQLIIGINPNS